GVREVFGGEIEAENQYLARVRTALGDFVCELDSSHAHPTEARHPGDKWHGSKLEREFRSLIGDVASHWMPTEVSAPPIPVDRLERLRPLVEKLRALGALGTRNSAIYAFGLQFNP